MNDYYGWIKYDELLKICDRYDYSVPIKGGFEVLNSKRLWITSNQPVSEWYSFHGYTPNAIYRRLTTYKIVTDDEIRDNEDHQRILRQSTQVRLILMKEIQKMEDQMEAEQLLTDSVRDELLNNEWIDEWAKGEVPILEDPDPHTLDHIWAQQLQTQNATRPQPQQEWNTTPITSSELHCDAQPFNYHQFNTQDVYGTQYLLDTQWQYDHMNANLIPEQPRTSLLIEHMFNDSKTISQCIPTLEGPHIAPAISAVCLLVYCA